MRTNIFKGNFREIGWQQGRIYRRNGATFGSPQAIDQALYRGQRHVYEKHYPQLLEGCQGVAEGGRYDADCVTYDLITAQLQAHRDQLRQRKGCTVFGVRRGSKLYVGRNYDFVPVAETIFGLYKIINPERNSFASVSDRYISGSRRISPKNFWFEGEDAVNDKGLYVGITAAHVESWSYGIAWNDLLRLVAETCTTVEDALKIFKRVPVCSPKNFFVADALGGMAVIEHAVTAYRVIRPKDGVLIHTNHFLHPDLLGVDRVLKDNPAHTTFLRYYEALREINARKRAFERRDIPAILRKPGSYLRQDAKDEATIWTLALDMAARDYVLYWGLGDAHRRARFTV